MIPSALRRFRELYGATDSASPWSGPVALVAIIVLGQGVVRCLLRITALPEESYFQAWLLPEWIIRFPWHSPLALLILPIAGILVWKRDQGIRWADLEHGRLLRWLFVAAALMLVWQAALYPYNYYLDRGHWGDRGLALCLAGLFIWRPGFVFPLLIFGLLPVFQLEYPLLGFSWSPLSLPVQLLALFAAFLVLGRLTRAYPVPWLWLAIICLCASHYWASGYTKLRLGWLFYDQVHFLLPNTYAGGWWGLLEPKTVSSLTRGAAHLNPVIKIFTLAVECLCLGVLFWGRRSVTAFLAAWIAFHVGIFLFTGICVWQWAALELLLLIGIYRAPTILSANVSRPLAIAATILIGSGPFWMKLPVLTWSDARATYTYDVIAVHEDGTQNQLSPRFFAPTYYEFSLGRFAPLVRERPLLPIVWGATDKATAKSLNACLRGDAILELEKTRGKEQFRVGYEERFTRFIQRFVGNHNRQGGRHDWLRWISYPPVTQHWEKDDVKSPSPIRSVRVRQRLTFFDGREYQTLRDVPVLEIEIPPSPTPE